MVASRGLADLRLEARRLTGTSVILKTSRPKDHQTFSSGSP